ncbi:hypothetical protein AMS68_005664 [Peltaster fructicola]|uniref:Uncharacterized protein n=1 Tax=Peltaster fructicola TaxID=286661 RepID=A0A6H0XZG9_9PEZI|nr:hypothetical protein AMS68_005664 [Peltaster fructicola]
MANGVSSGVRSIIESFINGLDVLSKLREKHKRKKQGTSRTEDDCTRLSRSLRQGPEEIGLEYERGMRLDERYAHGDGIAQHSLAEILLRLNTGLVSIIASFLDRDRASPIVDFDSLTSLSEISRKDSLNVLRQLYQRMATRQVPVQIKSSHRSDKPAYRGRVKQTKIRGPTIARVTVEDSSKRSQLAVVKPKKKSPSSSTSNLTKTASRSSSTTAVSSSVFRRPPQQRANSSSALPKEARTTRPTQRAQMSKSSPDLPLPVQPKHDQPQPLPPVPAVPRLPLNNTRRRDTPTMYSIATDSTKLGEIPLHRWAVPYDFDTMSTLNREAMQSGWPLTDLDGKAVFKPKRRFGFFRLFKRKETTE